jgi:serine/threonine protein kinase
VNALGQADLLASRYRLEGIIGSGGMGTVWRAHDLVLTRDVAVKEIIWPPFSSEAEQQTACRRALREAQMAARLRHPNVVTIYDIVEEDDRPWIVMELLPYRSLRDIVRDDGPLPPPRAADLGMGVLAALRAAHREGILHRDVKPGNILVGSDGRVVLTDFGIARAAGSPTLTNSGILIGSPSYISPERALGGHGDAASDLWGLGASLYTAVEGRPPFEREGALPSLTAVVADEPDPIVYAGPLWPLISRLLIKDPGRRLGAPEAERMLQKVATTGVRRPRWTTTQLRGSPRRADALPPAEPPPERPEPFPQPASPQPQAVREPPSAQPQDVPDPSTQPQDVPDPSTQADAVPEPSARPEAVPEPSTQPLAVHEPSAPPGPRTSPSEHGAPGTEPGPEEAAGRQARWREHLSGWRGHLGILAIVAAVVAVAGTGAALALMSSPGHQATPPRQAATPSRGASPAAVTPGRASPRSPSASSSASTGPTGTGAASGSTSTGAAAGYGALPAGYDRFTNSTGFSIGIPPGWTISHVGHYVYVNDPVNPNIFLLIDQSDQPNPNPLADWEQQQANRESTYSDYHLIRLAAVSYPQAQKAADWEFTYDRDGVPVHILNRNILANAHHAYALYWSTPQGDWDADYHYFQAFAATFRPAAA